MSELTPVMTTFDLGRKVNHCPALVVVKVFEESPPPPSSPNEANFLFLFQKKIWEDGFAPPRVVVPSRPNEGGRVFGAKKIQPTRVLGGVVLAYPAHLTSTLDL
jgi:hypothetical protein